jgi:hypothetical protein
VGRLPIILAVAAIAGVATLVWTARDENAPAHTTPRAAGGNYRILTAAQSARLLDFAVDVRACAAEHGVTAGRPKPMRTRITLATNAPAAAAAHAVLACEAEIGAPPRGSSLQARKGQLVLYLPKQCLLDPKVDA